MKSRSFVALGDGSSLAPLQAIVPMNQAEGCDPEFPDASVSAVFIVTDPIVTQHHHWRRYPHERVMGSLTRRRPVT